MTDLIVNHLFRFLARYSLEAISFIYTFTILVVVVFAIEIEQKITGRGKMELSDIIDGLWGFIIAFFAYLLRLPSSAGSYLGYQKSISTLVTQIKL